MDLSFFFFLLPIIIVEVGNSLENKIDLMLLDCQIL